MKLIRTLIAAALVLSAGAAQAQTTMNTIGGTTYVNNGSSTTTYNQIVYEKYHGQLYGNPSFEGAERKAVSRTFYAEQGVCTDNYSRKMTALWNSQPPAVKAFYEQRRTELHSEIIAIEKEAKR